MRLDHSAAPEDDIRTDAPRVEALIEKMMEQHTRHTPKALAKYFEDVHQELAPLAREMERDLQRAKQVSGDMAIIMRKMARAIRKHDTKTSLPYRR